MLGCLAADIDLSMRVVVAEEVFETIVELPNVAHMQTRPARSDRKEVDLRRLVAGFLRTAPDVAIVGEVRDREALLAHLIDAQSNAVLLVLHGYPKSAAVSA